jgi:hypothetical protein
MQVSIFSPAMHFEQYCAPRASLANRNGCQGFNYGMIRVLHQDLILAWQCGAEASVTLPCLKKKHPAYRDDTSVATLQKYFVKVTFTLVTY